MPQFVPLLCLIIFMLDIAKCGFLSGVAVCHVHMVGVGLEEVGRHAVPVHLHLHTQHCVTLLILHNTNEQNNLCATCRGNKNYYYHNLNLGGVLQIQDFYP